ncbi:phage integrase SAM-like domain-containing protein [Enterococcus ureasiticus]|uniref:phage integrase SAM-like domain-containing protein n=1 Tax=Enterococcus ureasiticus TaxID=903984 RepID=UPI0030FCB8BB
MKQSTFFNYEWLIKKYILPYIGEKKLSKLTSDDIRMYKEDLEKLELSHGTTSNVFILLKTLFEEAENQQIISSNPCRSIQLSRKKVRKGCQLL